MISDQQLRELRDYRTLECDLPLSEENQLGPLVASAGNDSRPIHRWFRFKEGYSGDLLDTLLSKYVGATKELNLIDPFCGMGTTLLCAQTHRSRRITAVGLEYNPFIRFAAVTKLRWPEVDPQQVLKLGEKVIDASLAPGHKIPRLSSFITGRCMSRYVAQRLIGIRDAIRQHGNTANHSALLLGLAASVEALSRTRKDGRALRLVDRPRQLVEPVLREKWAQIADDTREMQKSCSNPNSSRVLAGDGRNLHASGIESNSIDVVVTSPPYLNNIDYSEVYKLELWLMDFVSDTASFLKLRKGTLRSHPTSELSAGEEQFLERATRQPLNRSFETILSKLDTDKEKWRRRLFLGYFADLLSSLKQQYLVLRTDGLAFIVVGNSLHGGKYAPYVVATDLLICELARSIGFSVEKLSIARGLRRRLSGNHFLRESVVILRKPRG